MGVKKFSYKDKVSGEVKPSAIVYGMDENGTTIKPLFFTLENYNKTEFDKYVLDKEDVASIYKDYKSCQIDFDQAGFFVKLSE